MKCISAEILLKIYYTFTDFSDCHDVKLETMNHLKTSFPCNGIRGSVTSQWS
jgi:hypothetical protein